MIQARLTDSFFLRRKEVPGDSEPHFQANCGHPPHFYERACAPLGNKISEIIKILEGIFFHIGRNHTAE